MDREWGDDTIALIDNLVSYYKLDESSGTVIDSEGTNDGTNTGATPNVAGIINTAYLFGAGDYIQIPDSDDFNIPNGSIYLWAKPTGVIGASEYFIGKDDGGSNDDFGYRGRSDGKVEFFIQTVSSGTKTIISNSAISADTWANLVVTFGSGGMKMYVDSILQTDTDAYTGGINGATADLFIGALTSGTTAYTGEIDELGIWGKELTQSEVTDLYNSGAGLAYPFLIVPTVQATNVLSSNVATTSMTLDWTRGDGDNIAVFAKETSTGEPAPVDDTAYSADANFTDGDQIGSSGWYCIFNGSGTTVNVTGLTIGADYRIMGVEYNG